MATRDIKTLVFADWVEGSKPILMGSLFYDHIRSADVFRFEYDPNWLASPYGISSLDPGLGLYSGPQFADNDKNFRIFLDSCPDTWGRLLMRRREAALARQQERQEQRLTEIDYLLGVHDANRMGGLRFKSEKSGNFLNDVNDMTAPPLTKLRALEHAASRVEDDDFVSDPDYTKWLSLLISPGSSLGGARPKANVSDEGQLWIAKFPAKNDRTNIGLWEYVTYKMAIAAKIHMAESRAEKYASDYHTFLTKRFDRKLTQRIHFSSAMTQLEYYDGEEGASYLDLAEFIANNSCQSNQDLRQLWRRIVFNIAVSNTDDHLRNHGFIWAGNSWILSPAYDINPSTDKNHLHLNITENAAYLDFNLAFEIINEFRITREEANDIYDEVLSVVAKWKDYATAEGLNRSQIDAMSLAFNV